MVARDRWFNARCVCSGFDGDEGFKMIYKNPVDILVASLHSRGKMNWSAINTGEGLYSMPLVRGIKDVLRTADWALEGLSIGGSWSSALKSWVVNADWRLGRSACDFAPTACPLCLLYAMGCDSGDEPQQTITNLATYDQSLRFQYFRLTYLDNQRVAW